MPGGYEAVRSAGLSIRVLTEQDLDEVLDLERQGYSNPWSESVFRSCFRENYRLWGIEISGQLAGYGVVAYLVDEAHLLNLCVARRHRKEGAGRLLFRHLIAQAARDGMSRLLLEVRQSNAPAIALYQGEGLERIGLRPGYYPDAGGGEDAIVMALPLSLGP